MMFTLKYSSPTTADLSAKLNSAQLHRQARGQCLGPGTLVVSATNVHICHSIVSGRAGGYAPGMLAVYMRTRLKSQGWD